jgi:hypothetical protein
LFCRAYSWKIINKLRNLFGVHGIIQSESFFSNAELLIKISLLTNQLLEVPAVYDYGKKRGASKIRYLLTCLEYFTMIRRLRKTARKISESELASKS